MRDPYEDERVLAEYERHNLEPPADPEPAEHCDRCGQGIYVGERVWEIDGDILCDECARWLYSKELGNE